MWEFFERIFGEGFMPHGHCYLWSPSMVWTQVTANLLIGLAYASITLTLGILVKRIRDIPFTWAWVAFGVFILSCGLTHFFDVVTVWHPVYWADAGVRVITAAASVSTAIFIWPMVPQVVAVSDAARLSESRGRELQRTVAELERAHEKLAQREREAQERASSSEERLRLFVEIMPQLAWMSGPNGATFYRNQRWTHYTGATLEDIEAKGWDSFLDPELRASVVENWEESLRKKTPFDIECRFRRADGEYRWFLARATPLIDKRTGEVTVWVGTATDIHDQRTLRDEAIRTTRMKDEFLATVSHELRTPLNALLGWSRMLRSNRVADDKRDRALEAIERNAVAQAHLIEELLDVSRIVSGKMRVDLALTHPGDAVDAAVEALRPMAAAKEIALELGGDRSSPMVMADGGRLQQIIWNLVANAIKFTPRGGRVDVSVHAREVEVDIVVSDTGEGIAPEFISHVFERFSQADQTTQRRQGGLGLGLAIAKHLVELHGGTLRVESAGRGLGASFTVTLPVPRRRVTSQTPSSVTRDPSDVPADAPAELRGLHVLLVEDDADARELYTELLVNCGAIVLAAADAEAGARVLDEGRIEVIVSDIGLPGRDGYSFLRSVRQDPRFARVPAAAVSAYASADERRRALEAGFEMHLPKPVEPRELVSAVATLARLAAAAS